MGCWTWSDHAWKLLWSCSLFVHVFACLSKCSIWDICKEYWKTAVLKHIGDDSEKRASYSETGCVQLKAENLRLFIFFQAFAEPCYTKYRIFKVNESCTWSLSHCFHILHNINITETGPCTTCSLQQNVLPQWMMNFLSSSVIFTLLHVFAVFHSYPSSLWN